MPILSLHSQIIILHRNKSLHKSMDVNFGNKIEVETPCLAASAIGPGLGPVSPEAGEVKEPLESTPAINGSQTANKSNNAVDNPVCADSGLETAGSDNLRSQCRSVTVDIECREIRNTGNNSALPGVPPDAASMSAISEPVPCSSKDPSPGRPRAGMLAATRACTISDEHPSLELMRNPRKSFPLIPRISQYERNPLLQTKSKDGLSELEMFLMEKEERSLERRSSEAPVGSGPASVDVRRSSSSATRGAKYPIGERKLVPRGAHSEPHPLLQRSDSGMCEIEQFLLEKEQEINKQKTSKADEDSEICKNETETASANSRGKYLQRRSTLGKLEPRSGTCERNSFLEDKDQFGMTEMDRILQEKNRLVTAKGKCCSDSTCNSSQCPKCEFKSVQQTSIPANLSSSAVSPPTSPIPPGGEALSTKFLSSHNRRVHFERNEARDSDNLPVDSGLETSAVSVEILNEADQGLISPSKEEVVEDPIRGESMGRNDSGNSDKEKTNDKVIVATTVESKRTGPRKGCCIA